jgi:hypothetical protein
LLLVEAVVVLELFLRVLLVVEEVRVVLEQPQDYPLLRVQHIP